MSVRVDSRLCLPDSNASSVRQKGGGAWVAAAPVPRHSL